MTINLELSESGIRSAVNRILLAKENLQAGVTETLSELSKDGADEANAAYGEMAYASEFQDSETVASINVTGDDDETVIIAEFGAGYATMEDHPFAANAPVSVRIGSYSELHEGQFYRTDRENPGHGFWEFGGQKLSRVEPRHGLLNAYNFIMEHGTERAREVIQL